MIQLLTKLKKVVDGALCAHAATHEIALAEFPGHAVRSLERVLTEHDAERAMARLARLKAEVDDACALVKQDGDARIRVARFEEPLLTTKPQVEMELPVPYEADVAAAGVAKSSAKETFRAALARLAGEIAKLDQALGPATGGEDRAATGGDRSDAEAAAQAVAKAAPAESPLPDWRDWPFDMNTTMPGAEQPELDADLDWGPDPDLTLPTR